MKMRYKRSQGGWWVPHATHTIWMRWKTKLSIFIPLHYKKEMMLSTLYHYWPSVMTHKSLKISSTVNKTIAVMTCFTYCTLLICHCSLQSEPNWTKGSHVSRELMSIIMSGLVSQYLHTTKLTQLCRATAFVVWPCSPTLGGAAVMCLIVATVCLCQMHAHTQKK